MEEEIVKKEESSNNTTIIWIILVILLAVVLLYFMFVRKNEESTNGGKTDTQESGQRSDNQTISNDYVDYKTADGKYILRITKDDKISINGKEIVERDRINGNKYLQIFGDFNPPTGYITDLTFVLDKENKLIVEQNIYPIGQEDISAFGDYAKFSARSGWKLVTSNNIDYFSFESEGPTEYYTADWQKVELNIE